MKCGDLYLGYSATNGNIAETTGPNNYPDLSTVAKQQIRDQAERMLFDPNLAQPGLFSGAQGGSYPPLWCQTWNKREDIPLAPGERDEWIFQRLEEAKFNPAETYNVSALETDVRYVQNGDERICEHYYAITKESDGQPLTIDVVYNDTAQNPDHDGIITVTVFAIIHL